MSIGSSRSRTGEIARLTVSQSLTDMVPSGRSAMICTVQPFVAGDLHPHEIEAQILDHGLDDGRHSGGHAVFGNQPLVAFVRHGSPHAPAFKQ